MFTSRFEGLPIAILEAMAAKIFIVASKVNGCNELIKDNITGWIYDIGNYKQAAAIIKNIYNNRCNLEHVRDSTYNVVVKKYSPKEKMAGQYHEIYNGIINNSA